MSHTTEQGTDCGQNRPAMGMSAHKYGAAPSRRYSSKGAVGSSPFGRELVG